jgi:hypothetical protein
MEHHCPDTAYPAAAMPDECTCAPDQQLTSDEDLERMAARIRIFGSDPDAGTDDR